MVAVSTTAWWVIGWILGAAVVVVAAALLLTIITLARRIVRQASDITAALEGARDNTHVLFDIAMTNHSLERISRGVNAIRGKHSSGFLDRVTSALGGLTGREGGAGTSAAE